MTGERPACRGERMQQRCADKASACRVEQHARLQ